MTTLYIRYPARAANDGGAAQTCHYALVGDGGNVLQQGAGALGNLADLVASARRVVLLLAAADVTLLQIKVPPLSQARLKAALPNLVEDQLLGDPAACVLALAPARPGDALRTVAVVQRAWLDVLVKTLVAQGAASIAALPAQLCVPLRPGSVSAALTQDAAGLELTLRQSAHEGIGLSLAPQPDGALQTLRALAGDAPVVLYLAPPLAAQFQALAEAMPGVTVEAEHWAHWVAAAKTAPIDLMAGLGRSGVQVRAWQRWRWPLRIALLAVLVNIVGLNAEWLRLRSEAAQVRQSMVQIFRAAYPKESVIIDPAAQMRNNIAATKAGGGQPQDDEFVALSAALGEALAALPRRDVVASLEYRERSLLVKLKPDAIDGAGQAQVRQALAARKLALTETAPGTWQIRSAGGKS